MIIKISTTDEHNSSLPVKDYAKANITKMNRGSSTDFPSASDGRLTNDSSATGAFLAPMWHTQPRYGMASSTRSTCAVNPIRHTQSSNANRVNKMCASTAAETKDAQSVQSSHSENESGNVSVEIVAITDQWVAVNKPAGILMHRTKLYPSRRGEPFLVNAVRNKLSEVQNRKMSLFPIHRLDRPTTGIVLFGLDNSRNAAMIQQALQSEEAQKQYWTLAFGSNMPEHWENAHPLKDLKGKNPKQRNAKTTFEAIASFEHANITAVRATLATGRRHQIRRHLSNSRYPVVGDTSHGDTKLNHAAADAYGVDRLCLHARRLTFTDPFTSKRVYLQVPVPSDLRQVLEKLPGYTAQLDEQLDLEEAAEVTE